MSQGFKNSDAASAAYSSKGSVFVAMGAVVVFSAALMHYFFADRDLPTITRSMMILSVVVAYLAEKISQRCARVKLRWGGLNRSKVSRFCFYLLIWCAAGFAAIKNAAPSEGMLATTSKIFVVYMFASAIFEILNLLKTGVENAGE